MSVIFTLKIKNGVKIEYLDLIDTGSTSGMISKGLVQKCKFEIQNNDSLWDINAGLFKMGKRKFTKQL